MYITEYAEFVVPSYNLDDFRYNYRLLREAFDDIHQQISPLNFTPSKSMRKLIPENNSWSSVGT